MRSKHLHRLAGLTRGIALVGLGASDLACAKDMHDSDFHINAPADPTPSAQPPTANAPPIVSAEPTPSASAPPLRLPAQLNATIPSASAGTPPAPKK